MFKKRENDLDLDDPSFGSIASRQSSAPPSSDALDEETSIIGYSLNAEGTLSTDKNLRINGTVKGDIRAKSVTVGQDAKVEADIVSNEVVVAGSVTGQIRATKVRLCNTAVVSGEIVHKLFAIESGAQFEGTVRHLPDPLEEDEVPWEVAEEDELPAPQDLLPEEEENRAHPISDDSAW